MDKLHCISKLVAVNPKIIVVFSCITCYNKADVYTKLTIILITYSIRQCSNEVIHINCINPYVDNFNIVSLYNTYFEIT